MRRILFALFFISGFSSLVYQVVWTRLAFASFGIILPVLSVVISVFMLGLSVGAWGAGRAIPFLQRKTGRSAALFYAATELVIGVGAFVVPKLFKAGEHLLLNAGQTDSAGYLFLSAIALSLAILPWCLCMGATMPLMMAYVREREPENAESFSFLYLANVLGAMCGTLMTALVLVELFGFHRTLAIAAAGNGVVVLVSVWLGLRSEPTASLSGTETSAPLSPSPQPPPRGEGATLPHSSTAIDHRSAAADSPSPRGEGRGEGRKGGVHEPVAVPLQRAGQTSAHIPTTPMVKWILFATGFCAMAMEVVWTRAFTPVLRTQVYSFASIILAYLAATAIGSWLYRRDLSRGRVYSVPVLLSWLAVAAFIPILVDDFRLLPKEWRGPMDPLSAVMLLSSIGPLCAVLGYLTPSLIDSYARGNPGEAGKAYAVNVLGCILGPLVACYLLLPRINERYTLVLLSLPFLVFWFLHSSSLPPARRWIWGTAGLAALVCALFVTEDFQARVLRLGKHTQIRRDHTAFVVSVGEAREKLLMVNGMDMTVLSPVTKYMVHLPLSLHQGKLESVLVICFGMGTTHRASLSWGVETTTVELVPSVRDAFGFYHADAAEALRAPNGRIIIDDGRRFLARSNQKFDAIVLDPPPPVMAAGSSLLYSSEFYELAKQHLKPNGILQTWVPRHNIEFAPAIYRSLYEAFPYTRCFKGLESGGYHLLGSMQPILVPSAADLIRRIPPAAQKDLLEWSVSRNLTNDLHEVLVAEIPPKSLLSPDPRVRITDDRPYNEYYLLKYFR